MKRFKIWNKKVHIWFSAIWNKISWWTCSTDKSNIVEAEEDQGNPLKDIVGFNDKYRLRTKEGKDK